MTPLSVHAAKATLPAVRAVVGSLPMSFAVVPASQPAQVEVVAGSPGWAERARHAVRPGTSAVVIHEPAFTSPSQVRALAGELQGQDVAVALFEAWNTHPVVAQLVELIRGDAVLIESVAYRRCPVKQLLLAQLRLVHSVLGAPLMVRSADIGAAGYLITADVSSTAVLTPAILLGAVHNAPSARVLRLTGQGEAQLTVYDGELARPADARIADTGGETVLPVVHESSLRATWRRLRTMLEGGSRDVAVLEQFACDLDTLVRISR